ncbi:MAG: hypothetical protein BMS9Abin06_0946 [Gammaproteobacteria bacterium]|nr:MAG: hypothetical protein BMS9Abin06_0946 [Gammaproteobacteria bacterium]
MNVDYINFGSTIRISVDKDYDGNPYRMSLYTYGGGCLVPDPSAWKINTKTLNSSIGPSDGNLNEKPLNQGNGTGNPLSPRAYAGAGSSFVETQVLASREQGKSQALDVTPVLATEAFVLTAPYLFEGLREMARNMELVKDDPVLRCVVLD